MAHYAPFDTSILNFLAGSSRNSSKALPFKIHLRRVTEQKVHDHLSSLMTPLQCGGDQARFKGKATPQKHSPNF